MRRGTFRWYVGLKLIEAFFVGTFLFFCLAYERTLWEWTCTVFVSLVSAIGIDYLNGDLDREIDKIL